MALPIYTTGVSGMPDKNYYCGPFKAPNGNYYVSSMASSASGYESPAVGKATDPTDSWSPQDSGNASGKDDPNSHWSYMSGNFIHVVHFYDDGANNWYYYHRFDTSSDTWDVIDQEIDTWDDKYEPASPACSFVYRADDGGQYPYICFYNGAREKIGGTSYGRVDWAGDADGTGSWDSVGNAVDSGGETHWSGAVAVRGSVPDANGHVVHFFWGEYNSANVTYARTLRYDSGWQLSTAIGGPSAIYTLYHPFTRGAFYDDKVLIGHLKASDDQELMAWVIPEDSNGDLTTTGETNTVIDDSTAAHVYNSCPAACITIDPVSGKAYAVWSDNISIDCYLHEDAAPWNVWSGGGTELFTSSIDQICCSTYPRNGSMKVSLFYDYPNVSYNEEDIGQETAPGYAAARLPEQNYKIGPFSV